MDKQQIFLNQLNKLKKQEEKFLNQKENKFVKTQMKPVFDKLLDKVPAHFKSGLDMAFYKGFLLVFQKGSTFIEKTYDKQKIEIEYDLNNYAIDKHSSKRHLKKLDKNSGRSKNLNQSIAVLEGGILGFLGIGLPDIPIFISVMIKTIHEIALSYGYSYDTEEEKIYILYLICGAVTKEEQQQTYNEIIDQLGSRIDSMKPLNDSLEKVMKETAQVLSSSLLAAKAIQGVPLLGIMGGAVNPVIINRLGKYAKLKYKKRYLNKKLLEM